MTVERMFPVLASYWEWLALPGIPREVPWSLLAPYEANALRVHDQTLERLAQRGGLGVSEMVAIIDGTGYDGACRPQAQTLPRLLELLAAHAAAALPPAAPPQGGTR